MTIGAAVAVLGMSGPAAAKVFGTLESGYASFSNFRAVASERETISESARYSAANIGAYHALGDGQSTAVLAKMGLQDVRFDESEQLDNRVTNGDLGLYHLFRGGTSVMLLGGWRELKFEDSERDDRIVSGRLQLRKPFLSFDWQSEAYYEQGTEETLSGEYTGYGLSTGINWSPHSKWQFGLGVGVSRNDYEQSVTRIEETGGGLLLPPDTEVVEERIDRTEDMVGAFASIKHRLRDWLYISGSAAHRRITPDSDSDSDEFSGETYSLSLGVEF